MNTSEYFTDSMGWSGVGFMLGYLACRLEVLIRKRWRRDHS